MYDKIIEIIVLNRVFLTIQANFSIEKASTLYSINW